MKTEHEDQIRLINARIAHWTSHGRHGAALYDALADDIEIEPNLHPEVVAALVGLKPEGLRERRKNGLPPGFLRTSHSTVRYPRSQFFGWLKSRFVDRSPRGERQQSEASREYTVA